MERRTYLATLGGLLCGPVAGCVGDDTRGPSAESGSPPRHEIGDSFDVGRDGRGIRYRVESTFATTAVGSEALQTRADGWYLIIRVVLENRGPESIEITSELYGLVDTDGRMFAPDPGAGSYLSADSRVTVEPLNVTQLQPGLSARRALVFDVPPGTYELAIDPARRVSGARQHRVRVGTLDPESR